MAGSVHFGSSRCRSSGTGRGIAARAFTPGAKVRRGARPERSAVGPRLAAAGWHLPIRAALMPLNRRTTVCKSPLQALGSGLGLWQNNTAARRSQVRVKADLTVFHVPGFKSGIALKDMTGEVAANVKQFQGQELSANYPWKCQFEVESKGKPKKFFVHLVRAAFGMVVRFPLL